MTYIIIPLFYLIEKGYSLITVVNCENIINGGNTMVDEKKVGVSESKEKQMKAKVAQDNEVNYQEQPAGDIYSDIEYKDPETGVEVPTEEAVEEAKEWVDEDRQM